MLKQVDQFCLKGQSPAGEKSGFSRYQPLFYDYTYMNINYMYEIT